MLNQPEAQHKSIATSQHVVSRAQWRPPYGFFLQDLNWCVFVMIGQRDYSDYRFTSLNLHITVLKFTWLTLAPICPLFPGVPLYPGSPGSPLAPGSPGSPLTVISTCFHGKRYNLFTNLWSLSDPELTTEWKRCRSIKENLNFVWLMNGIFWYIWLETRLLGRAMWTKKGVHSNPKTT